MSTKCNNYVYICTHIKPIRFLTSEWQAKGFIYCKITYTGHLSYLQVNALWTAQDDPKFLVQLGESQASMTSSCKPSSWGSAALCYHHSQEEDQTEGGKNQREMGFQKDEAQQMLRYVILSTQGCMRRSSVQLPHQRVGRANPYANAATLIMPDLHCNTDTS